MLPYVMVINIVVKEACEMYAEVKRRISIWRKVVISKNFFHEPSKFEPFEGEVKVVSKILKGPFYDITKFDARKVVALLSQIGNDRGQFKEGNAFHFYLRNRDGKEMKVLFTLAAKPTQDQPGNGVVSLFSRETGNFHAPKHSDLNHTLKRHYESDTKSFASHMKKLFRNNSEVKEADFPQVTIAAYMVWLFEIARRSVTSVENPTEKKKQLDDLPIGSAISRLLKLLEPGSEEICTFEDVFIRKDRFYCFEGTPGERREAINRINETLHLQELSKTFCSKERQVEELTEDLRRL